MKYELKWLSLALILIIVMPHAIRFLQGNYSIIGDETHFSARISSAFAERDFSLQDKYFQGQRNIPLRTYDLILTTITWILGQLVSAIILPAILSTITFWLIVKILYKLKVSDNYTFFIILVFTLSPLFVFLATTSNRLSLIGLFIAAEIFFLLERGWKNKLAYLSGIFLSFYSIETGIANILLISSVLLWKKEKKNLLIIYSIITLAIILWYHLPPTLNQFQIPEITNRSTDFLADLGGISGVSSFAVLLMFLGIFNFWSYKRRFYFIYLFALTVIVGAFFFHEIIFFAHLAISLFAGIAFARFAEVKWKIMSLRNACLMVFFCGLLFSTISNAVQIANSQPSKELIEGLNWIKDYSVPNAIVFSTTDYGYWIENIAKKKAVLDKRFNSANDAETRYNDTYTILHSYNLEGTTKLLRKYDTDYILLTTDMWEGKVWSTPDQGLMFLLGNKDNFELAFNNTEVRIWEFIGK